MNVLNRVDRLMRRSERRYLFQCLSMYASTRLTVSLTSLTWCSVSIHARTPWTQLMCSRLCGELSPFWLLVSSRIYCFRSGIYRGNSYASVACATVFSRLSRSSRGRPRLPGTAPFSSGRGQIRALLGRTITFWLMIIRNKFTGVE